MTLIHERFGDIERLRMSSASLRAIGLDVSAYVIRGMMIDSGFHRVGDAMAEAVESLGVRGVIVTHWHEDHAGNVARLATRGVPILMREDTEAIVRKPPALQLYRHIVWGSPPPLDSAVIPFADDDLECVHTPGHSPDHQVVFDRRTGTLFSGDLWLGVRARVLHSAEDPYMIVESLHRAIALSPDRMFDAHRGRVESPVDALRAKANWLADMLGQIGAKLREGWSDRAIVRRLLGGEERSGYVSFGEYSRRNLVRAVRHHQSIR